MELLITDWRGILAVFSAVIMVGYSVPYCIDVLKGKTKPNFVTWFLWTVLSGVALLAQLSSDVSWSVMIVAGNTLANGLIALAALYRGSSSYTWLDTFCLVLAIVAICIWQLTDDPLIAIVFAIVGDLIASVPTVLKTFKHPRSERPTTFFVFAFAAVLSIVAGERFDFDNLAYPLYLVLIYALIGTLAIRHQRRKRHA